MTGGWSRRHRIVATQFPACLIMCLSAQADDRTPRQDDPAAGRPPPLTEPLDVPTVTPVTGFRYLDGALTLSPQLSFQSLFSSNVLEGPHPFQADVGIVLAPAIDISYLKNGFSTSLVASGRYTNYVLNDSQDKKEYLLKSSTKQKLGDVWSLGLDATVRENIVSSAALGAIPQKLNVLDAQEYKGTISYSEGAIFADIALRLKEGRQRTRDGSTQETTTRYARSVLDQINKIGYRFDTDRSVYALLAMDRSEYSISDAYDRDSYGYLAGIGFSYALSETLLLKGQLGHLWQDFADPRFKIVSTLTGFMNLNWRMDESWRAELSWSREASELIYEGTPGITVDTYGLALYKQLLSHLLVEARAEWTVQKAIQLPVTYDLLMLSIGAQHTLSPHTSVEYGYRYKWQNTSDNSENFVDHVVGMGLTYKF
ncbi:outer membrane beta-barrel protein [Pseudochelatococcus sp. B33]